MITLASDFGTPYPAAMKGVVLQRSDTRLVDVGHDLPRGSIRASAFWLREVLPTFPPATHLAVVDPGVGTDRAVLVARAGDHTLVGPDNGLLVPAARRIGSDADVDWFHADPGDPTSTTFHGRDVFAPLAAEVHETVASEGVGALDALERLTPADPVDCRLPEATVEGDGAEGFVVAVDDFGNVITNVPGAVLDGRDVVRVNGEAVPVGETFGAVDPGKPLVVVGSHGYVECDVNDGRGDEWFGLSPGNAVELDGVESDGR